MVARTMILLGCVLSIAALFFPFVPLTPQAISQESQSSATPLKDVCQEGSSISRCSPNDPSHLIAARRMPTIYTHFIHTLHPFEG